MLCDCLFLRFRVKMRKIQNNTHEILHSSSTPPLPTEASFGRVFTVVFILIAGINYNTQNIKASLIFLGGAAVIFLIAVFAPKLLRPFNIAWAKFGLLLHKIISPIILGAMFFALITPIGVVMRLFGWDALDRSFLKDEPSYWIDKLKEQRSPDSMRDQF